MGILLCLHGVGSALAVDGSWKTTGYLNDLWSESTNWTGDPNPVPGGEGSTVTLSPSSGGEVVFTIDGAVASRTVGTLIFGGTGQRRINTSGGGTLTFDNGTSNATLDATTTGGIVTLNPNVILASSLVIDNTREVSFNQSGSGISETGGARSITKNGEGVLSFSFDIVNTYSGGFTLNAGTVNPGSGSTFGTGTLTLNSGRINNTGGARNFTNTLVLGGNVTLGNASLSGVNTFSGATTLTGTRVLTVESHTVFSGVISDGGNGYGITKEGEGILELRNENNTFTGVVTVNAGTLSPGPAFTTSLRNVGGVVINNGATLATGTIARTIGGGLTVNNGTVSGSGNMFVRGNITVNQGVIEKNINNTGAPYVTNLSKVGEGTFELSGATKSYTGSTTVSAGTLIISGGAINNTSGIAINGGTLRYDSATALNRIVSLNGGTLAYNSAANYTGALTFTSGKLAGTNWKGNLDNLIIGANQTINPGNSPGIADTGNQTWAAGGTYEWEINNATGTAGTNWDLLNGTGTLTISATEVTPFTIRVTSLGLTNFDDLQNYEWLIADFETAITFDSLAFHIHTAGFTPPFVGEFSLHRGDAGAVIGGDDTQLWLVYQAIPEPSFCIALGLGLCLLVFRSKRLLPG